MILNTAAFRNYVLDTALLTELREWVKLLHLQSWHVFALFVLCLGGWRLPEYLKHRLEIHAIDKDFEDKGRRLEAKIEQERSKRLEKQTARKSSNDR